MARAHYFCIATKTSVTIDANEQIVVAPETNVYLYQNMNSGVKSILYLLWQDAQQLRDAQNSVEVDAESNIFRLTSKNSNGNKRTVIWTAVPCNGIKNQGKFNTIPEPSNEALDFVSMAYADYEAGRKAMVNGLLNEGATEEELREAGITPDEESDFLKSTGKAHSVRGRRTSL